MPEPTPVTYELGNDSPVGIPVIRRRGDATEILAYVTADGAERRALAFAVIGLLQRPAERAAPPIILTTTPKRKP